MSDPAALLCGLLEQMALEKSESLPISSQYLSSLPPDSESTLRSTGFLDSAQPGRVIACPGCEENCLREVHALPASGTLPARAFIVCDRRDDVGRVPVDFGSLQQFKLSLEKVARFVAEKLSFSRTPQRLAAGLFSLGVHRQAKQRREVLFGWGKADSEPNVPENRYFRITLADDDPGRPEASISLRRILIGVQGGLHCDKDLFETAFTASFGEEAKPQYVFRKTPQGGWEFQFEDLTHYAPKEMLGFRYLHQLMLKPHQKISAVELAKIDSLSAVGNDIALDQALEENLSISITESVLPGIDVQSLQRYRQRLMVIFDKLEEAKEFQNTKSIESLESERDILLNEILTQSGRRSKESPVSKKARQSSGRAIRRAIKYFHKHLPCLGQHLESSITEGAQNSYRPKTTPAWKL